MNTPKLTVIMPVYNEAEYIAFAIESVLSQRTTFPFILLIVDDASQDTTLEIVKKYQSYVKEQKATQGCVEILVIEQKRNRGKGYAMYTAYTKMQEYQDEGYFLILDGDDFFTLRNKLQRQVDLLEENTSYIGCGHEYISALADGTMFTSACYKRLPQYEKLMCEGIHNIEDYPNAFYYSCSSTMMYRNIFKRVPPPQGTSTEKSSGVPSYFAKRSMEGDTALLFWFFLMTNQRVTHIDMIGSCYNIHGDGIWTGLTMEEKTMDTRKMMSELIRIANDEATKKTLMQIGNDLEYSLVAESEEHRSSQKEYLTTYDIITQICASLPQDTKLYYSSYLDSLIESMGKFFALKSGIYRYGAEYKEDNIGLLCSSLQDATTLISRISSFLDKGKNVHIFYTGLGGDIPEALLTYCTDKGVEIHSYSVDKERYLENVEEHVCFLLTTMYRCELGSLYCYIDVPDIVGSLCIQDGVAGTIIFDNVEQGIMMLGMSISVIDSIIVNNMEYGYALAMTPLFQSKSILVRGDNGKEKEIDMKSCKKSGKGALDVLDIRYS